jgi:hypothetical protein
LTIENCLEKSKIDACGRTFHCIVQKGMLRILMTEFAGVIFRTRPVWLILISHANYDESPLSLYISSCSAARYNLSSYLQSIDEGNNLASNKARAHFTLSGYHFNPDDITRLLGIEPTSVDASGAHSALDKPVISSWELSTETMTDNIDVYKMTDIIIKKIEPAKEKILQVIKSHNLSPRIGVVLVLSIDKNESAPDVGFGARTIRFLAEIGAFINVDYQLSERI